MDAGTEPYWSKHCLHLPYKPQQVERHYRTVKVMKDALSVNADDSTILAVRIRLADAGVSAAVNFRRFSAAQLRQS